MDHKSSEKGPKNEGSALYFQIPIWLSESSFTQLRSSELQ